VKLTIAAWVLAAAVVATAASAQPTTAGGIDPGRFSARVTNPWFPLRPGTTFRYRGMKEGKRLLDVFAVSNRVKRIMGVPCVVVRDRLYLDGRLEESTYDWYTQDRTGSVWYFGEATRELDRHGRTISTEGSWQAGRDGAQPGIFMPAHPRVGQSFRQEFYKGHAEDRFRVLTLNGAVKVPYGSFRGGALVTKEWTPLEPNVVDHKYYVRGVGEVKETSVSGPRELGELVSVMH
jgi:hypothetical protein